MEKQDPQVLNKYTKAVYDEGYKAALVEVSKLCAKHLADESKHLVHFATALSELTAEKFPELKDADA